MISDHMRGDMVLCMLLWSFLQQQQIPRHCTALWGQTFGLWLSHWATHTWDYPWALRPAGVQWLAHILFYLPNLQMSLWKRDKEILLTPKAKTNLRPDLVSSAHRCASSSDCFSSCKKLIRSKSCQKLVYWLSSTDGGISETVNTLVCLTQHYRIMLFFCELLILITLTRILHKLF